MSGADTPLRAELLGVARAFQRALSDLPVDPQLVDVARSALPDARERLDHVVNLTERAAHATLDGVDALRATCERAERVAAGLPPPVRSVLEQLITEQRGHCAALATAQAYQDLTGQIIRRVTRLMHALESDLLSLADGRPATATTEAAADLRRGCGPAVTVADGPRSTQDDADALLSSLGL